LARTPSEQDAVGSAFRDLGRHARTTDAELTTSRGANRAVRETIGELGQPDFLINNAGAYRLFTNHLTHAVTALDITEGD